MRLSLQGGAYAGGLAVLVLLVRFALAFYDKACCKEVRRPCRPLAHSASGTISCTYSAIIHPSPTVSTGQKGVSLTSLFFPASPGITRSTTLSTSDFS